MPIQSFSAPIINLNGSSPERLIEDISKALHALNAATVAVALTAPNGRDWQTATGGEMLYRQARADHERRLHSLHVIHDELEAIGLAIQDQADKGRRK